MKGENHNLKKESIADKYAIHTSNFLGGAVDYEADELGEGDEVSLLRKLNPMSNSMKKQESKLFLTGSAPSLR